MASTEQKSIHESDQGLSRDDEKCSRVDVEALSTIHSLDGDEALKLVGTERTVQFSEEYNRRLRRKLV